MGEVNKGNTTGACSNKKQASILSFFKTQNNKIKKESSMKCNNDKSCEEKESKEKESKIDILNNFVCPKIDENSFGNSKAMDSDRKGDIFSSTSNFDGCEKINNNKNSDSVKYENNGYMMDNAEISTEEDIIVKKKRKIILDSSYDEYYGSDSNDQKKKKNFVKNEGVDHKLKNLLYDANKKGEDILINSNKEDDNNNTDIKYVQRKKVEDNKKSQELDYLRNKFLNLPITLNNDKFRLYIEQYFLYCNSFEFPKWIQPQYIRDINLNPPDNPNYDSSTIWTPPQDHQWAIEYKQAHYTPGMQQFWKIKSKNFDKIIFFKMGRFYEIFYIDACIMHTICGLNWMNGEQKPHLGFPEQSLHLYAKKVINSGHKVVVIEQMETPKELEQRNKTSSGPKDKAIKREINEIYTKGTILHDNMLSAETKYIICFHFDDIEDIEDDNNTGSQNRCNFGFVVSDVATSYISVGYCNDDESRIELRTLLAQLCPAEILYCSKNISKEVLSIFKNIPTCPELTSVNSFPNIIASLDEVNKYFENIPKALEAYKEQNSVICAFGGFIVYLRSLLLDKKILKFCKIEFYDLFKKDNYMVLDATALKHLEILETQSGETKNSLYDYVNKTCTNFGARNMRRWVCSPLLNCDKINQRLDVVEFLRKNDHILSLIRLKLKKLPDIERLLNKICIQASQSERGAVFFDNIVNTKLKEFVTFLNAFKEIDNMLIEINSIDNEEDLIPTRLFEITNTYNKISKNNIKGNYPEIDKITNEFLEKIYFDGEKEYKPAEGCDEAIDAINKKEKDIEKELNNILVDMKKNFKIPNLKYVHAKYKYEIECPDNVPKSFLKEVEITSVKKGFIRIQNEEIKNLVEMLEDIEQEKKDAIYPFFQKIFHLFYEHYEKYISACRLISELDCLQAFAYVALNTSFPLTRPILHFMECENTMDNKSEDPNYRYDLNCEIEKDRKMGSEHASKEKKPFLILENNIHPVVATLMPNFIPNNIYMGCDKEKETTLLLTGPNMGGKSTLLRQTAISVILAQIGAFVPSTYCELTIVDKIFTRLGSSDNLFEGKSTFLVELEDISNLLKQSTKYSLAILDELGRGTSSFDGTAIALSTLEQISDTIKCRCIFSTHYHLLVEEVKHNTNISNYHMSLSIDDDQEKIIFLYKFIKGICPKSFGIHIAKLAGLPKEIIELAHEKSLLFENVTDEFCKIIKYKNIIRSLLKASDDTTLAGMFQKYKCEFT
ncbi:DNA mismatch repair protein MSH6, putative [Plasmodium berghei]|uniref:DNA mismatch repair protein n=1 Tax=Plasmodium berghei TaxID=5821 RepID=A0A113RZ32_PLABE|nr:DNA mismatch repair protein MSH6, putative [Plasmodium berghei]SCO60904.1 DNA mismatch repair protein MSH6, putative [Plasmodium berghei]